MESIEGGVKGVNHSIRATSLGDGGRVHVHNFGFTVRLKAVARV